MTPQLEALVVSRAGDGDTTIADRDYRDSEQAQSIIHNLQSGRASSSWGDPFYSGDFEQFVLNVRMPVHRGDAFVGAYVAVVALTEFSGHLANYHSGFGEVPFILTGDRRVLAHAEFLRSEMVLGEAEALPTASELNDPVLAALGTSSDRPAPPIARARIPGYEARHVTVEDGEYVLVFEQLYGIGPIPWIVGCYFPSGAFTAELKRLDRAALAGLAILIVTLFCAWILANALTQPTRRFAKAAIDVQRLGPDRVKALPPTRLAELDNAGRAFNEMVAGLRERETMRDTFGKYVPRSIASAILQARGVLEPQTRRATTLFTDIVGFIGICG